MKRRNFIRKTLGVSVLAGAGIVPLSNAQVVELQQVPTSPRFAANDKIRLGCIGMGIISQYDIKSALEAGGSEIVAACDLYTGRLTKAKETYGKNLFTTRDYRELLARKDIDAVIIATPDHWHTRIAMDALAAGKHVYCEKPLIHKPEEGKILVEAAKKSDKILQVGSQRVSSLAFNEAKKHYEQGAIGAINMVVANIGRHSSLGAWQYSIPPDANPQTVDYETFLGNAPKTPFDATRFFRWRNYRDYGTGIPGDLFVHLISGVHYITGSLGPERVFASGQLSYWKDGRDVPDVVSAVMEYPATATHPAFQMVLSVNFADGSGGGEFTRIIGTEGMIELTWTGFTLKRSPLPKAPGYGGYDSFNTFTKEQQEAFEQQYKSRWKEEDRKAPKLEDIVFKQPQGYDERTDHFRNFYASIREGKPNIQDAAFGVRAAGPCLAANLSVAERRIAHWNPAEMTLS